ncbi:MAG: AraC family transcriptional regulator, partial [Bacteroidota bacterium]
APAPLPTALEKSIAVLPFQNESSDSTNLYFVNGLMAATIGKLQKIEDLRVISRTSSEKYRNSGKGIPEIAEELHVAYLVEGSGQRVGNQVLLNVQLIDAAGDRPVWTQQYSRQVTDIFDLQNEVARQITQAIEAVVTPSELQQIEKKPTENLVAYDYFLQALEPFHTQSQEGYAAAIPLFEQAVAHDDQFALAYADLAICYYFLDLFQADKQYTEQINRYSDQALLYDSQSDISLLSKAFYYFHVRDYRLALPHLEKALEYNPNSTAILQMLSEFYAFRKPNTAKYLEYALRGIQLDVMGQDSTTKSYSYLHLSNALTQAGFLEEAATYVNLSLDFFAENPFATHLKIFIGFAQDRDTEKTVTQLIAEWQRDTTRLDFLQDIGKIYYTTERYDTAYFYYKKLVDARKRNNLRIFQQADASIAFVYQQMGLEEEAEELFRSYEDFCAQDETRYRSMNLAVKHAYLHQVDSAMEQLTLFSTQENYQYWLILLELDPMLVPLHSHPDFENVVQRIKDRFWEDHHQLRQSLVEKELI